MKYVIGIDGGGTKTRGILLNHEGQSVKDITLGPSNYHTIGADKAQIVLAQLIAQLTDSLDLNQVTHCYFGLSGADLPADFDTLHIIVNNIIKGLPYTIENDTWCVFRSGLRQNWGAVSLYGTGANAGTVSKTGEKHILRALGYAAGGYGGGDEIALAALHHAFRADEHTGPKTRLTEELPKLLGLKNMEEIIDWIHPSFKISTTLFKSIPPLVFSSAALGDEVSKDILKHFGTIQGEMVGGLLKRADLCSEEVPIVLGGSVYKGCSSEFIDSLMSSIQSIAPKAFYVHPEHPPVVGCLLYALEASKVVTTDALYNALNKIR